MKVKCNRCGHIGDESEFPKGRDLHIRPDPHMMRDQQLVKRVIGLPGERVTMRDGEVFIDGQPLKESYIDETTLPGRGMEVSLSDEEVFVLGDNRSNSSDSRNLGPIPLDSVLGKVVFVLAPDRMELVLCQS